MIRRPEIKFLPVILSVFLGIGCARCPKGAKMGSERPSADRFQAVSDTIARDRRLFPSWTLFAHRSLHLYPATRKTNDAVPEHIVNTSVPSNGLPDLLGEKERCDRNHHGIWWIDDNALQEALNDVLAA